MEKEGRRRKGNKDKGKSFGHDAELGWGGGVSVQPSYPHEKLYFLVVLHLLFVEGHGLVVMAAEHTVTLHHSFPSST